MPISADVLARRRFGNGYMNVCSVTFDNSYPTGGEAVTARQLGLEVIDMVIAAPANGYIFEFDHSNKKLKAFTPTVQHTHDLLITGGQAAGDALQQLAGVIGKTGAGNVTAVGGASNIQNKAAAPATEVANGTDLSAISTRIIAIGY